MHFTFICSRPVKELKFQIGYVFGYIFLAFFRALVVVVLINLFNE
jgi:hypothetical protein